MAARTPRDQSPPAGPRLYVRVPRVENASNFAPDLDTMLDGVDVAAVLLCLPEADEHAMIEHAKVIATVVQSKGIALVLDGHPELVARVGADGAHLTGFAAFAAAFDTLKPAHIAGVGGLTTRHDAMLAAERGADYLMFGEPDPDGGRPGFDAILERVAWWAEVFQAPCVAFAADLDEVAALAAAGADFVALDIVPGDAQAASLIRTAAQRLHTDSMQCG